ncbi:PREDICTED: pentatricopeptide repeat-containing protein At2g20540 isoform X1 [Nelumbo nucifera]|uniref:Pentatricopeptide repeat-containing protein At2g20540 isoform X1 n=2 Tax=Nelumbo nucifera TaxID=4432 RepID=A0A1U8Q8S2_NELNU|nr:PREDICTED: pentatricopeptide repeat-containing protein At2g20540 isoform X1 [Nelumbo nucifera]XP_019055000.1 PREDICTED: pentatricopeptide repeat-containing protein At2g20540 isoform X1 [Nelumbo nucifera]XP_019055001.1 PREDICTED: pentatricopeptide repeat-containing protein At2g20540 isoform X1 [Nelumbo nucifera]XP_019055002.1 PREDICTED: pentatricopeptide repeat-containing protein At2g20540 isoform X1 [Nelumbo nucifera]DAD32151.1 TPA_asm: hypothetical protein HUJ06_011002 [Nelumbo nucifera]
MFSTIMFPPHGTAALNCILRQNILGMSSRYCTYKIWSSPFINHYACKIYHFRNFPAVGASVLKNQYNTINQNISIDWASQNELYQRYPRLHALEEQCKSVSQLKQFLSYIFVSGLHRNSFVRSRVLYFCVCTSEDEEADLKRSHGTIIFNQIERPSIFSWNTMIRAFAFSKHSFDNKLAFHYYVEMLRLGTLPDRYTFPFLLEACKSSCELGLVKQVHCHVLAFGYATSLFAQNALLNLYLVCESPGDAWQLFDEMIERDVVSWTTMISGLASQGFYTEAFFIFTEMIGDESYIQPNVATIISVISACVNLGSLDHTQCLHAYTEKIGWTAYISVRNSLIDAYGKCGNINCAYQVFHEIQGLHRDVYSWTALIAGLAMHGHGRDAISLFRQMKGTGVLPDAITFIAVLSACAHAGLVDEGMLIFESMEAEFGIVPQLQHYGCMVDLFSRAGLLEHAYGFVEKLPMDPNLEILGSLLSACRVHNNMVLGENVLKKIESLCQYKGGACVLLSNLYAEKNQWCEAVHVREEMRGEQRKEKPPGRSWIQVKGAVHEFVVGDKSHPQAMELYMALDGLGKLLFL